MTTAATVLAAAGRVDHAPGPASWIAAALLLVVFICGVIFLAAWSVHRWNLGDYERWDLGGYDPDDGDDGGGRRPDGHPTPPSRAPDAEPDWWTEFECQFAAYVKNGAARPR